MIEDTGFGLLTTPRPRQLLTGEEPDRLQHPIPGDTRRGLVDDEGSLDQVGERFQDRSRLHPGCRRRHLEIEPGRKHSQVFEDAALLLVEELIRPTDGGFETQMTIGAPRPRTGDQIDPGGEMLQHETGIDARRAGRSQFDRKW